jgi:hypothetical protein
LVSVQSVVADPSLKELAARTEVRPIETLTLTDQQFLTGDKSGKAAVIAGELRLPQGASGRLPAVVLMHGSGGAGPREEFWSKTFNEMGIASFLVDSFSGRGLTSVSANQAMLMPTFRRTRGSIAPVSLSWGSRAAARRRFTRASSDSIRRGIRRSRSRPTFRSTPRATPRLSAIPM